MSERIPECTENLKEERNTRTINYATFARMKHNSLSFEDKMKKQTEAVVSLLSISFHI